MRYILFALIALTVAACGDSKEQHIAQAKEYIAHSDYPAAIQELHDALELDVRSAEVRWLLGKAYRETGKVLEAEEELQQAQQLGWPKDDVRPLMAQTLLAQGKFQEVLRLDFRDLNAVAAAHLLSTQALAAVSANQVDIAQELVSLALEKAPQLQQAKLAEATVLVHQGALVKAMVLIDAILTETPDNGAAWGLKGQVLQQQGKLQEARAAYDQSIAHLHMVYADRVARALINLKLRDFEAARADATQLLELSPKDPAANYIRGILYFHDKQIRKAITALTIAEPAAEQFPLVLYYLSVGYMVEKDLELAETYGERFVRANPDDSGGRKLLAAIQIQENKFDAAREVLQPVLDHEPDDARALNIMGNALLLDEQADQGLALYSRITQLRPDWGFVPLRQETALVTSGIDNEVSLVAVTPPEKTANFPQDEILSILHDLATKDFSGAIETAKSYQYMDLESLAPYAVLGRVLVAANKPGAAREVYEKALKRDPGDPAANQGLAALALADNHPDAARQYYEAILKYYENDLPTLLQLAALDSKQKNTAAMIAGLEHAATVHPNALAPRLELGRHYFSTGRFDRVVPLFAKLTTLQQRSPRVLELTALAHLAQRQFDSALSDLQLLVASQPDVVHYHYLLATVANAVGDKQKNKQELLEVIRLDPKHQIALIALAKIARDAGDKQQFEQHLAALVALAPDAPDVLRLRAAAAKANGNVIEALALSQRAFFLAPTTQTVLEVVAYQKAAGGREAARNILQVWLAGHPTDVDARLTLANDIEQENNLLGAREQYFKIVEQQPDNTEALKNLAWSLRGEMPVVALAVIRRAITIAPGQPDLLDTLAVIEHLAGDHDSAHRSILRALEASPGNLTMRYHQAMIEAARGEKAAAIALLEALVVPANGTFPERVEATKLLQSLKG